MRALRAPNFNLKLERLMSLAVTVKGGFWGDTGYGGGTMTLEDRDPIKRLIGQKLKKPGMRELKEIMLTLNGAAAGSAASATYKRVKSGEVSGSFTSELGGLRTIETVTDISRVTTAADKTELDNQVIGYSDAPTYVANGDGNPLGYPGG
jgi:hypothetical protein